MKKKIILILAMAFVFCLSISMVQAASTISLAPELPAVDAVPIVIDVTFATDTGVLSGALDFTYDPVLVSLASFDLGAGVDPSFFFAPDTATPGEINNFGFGNFTGLGSPLATMTFIPLMADPAAAFGILFDADNTGGGGLI